MTWGGAWEDHGLVFVREDGSPLNPSTIGQQLTVRAKQAELPHVRVHDLRHTYATLALQAGVHPKVVSERLGHANISITLNSHSHVSEGRRGSCGRALHLSDLLTAVGTVGTVVAAGLAA